MSTKVNPFSRIIGVFGYTGVLLIGFMISCSESNFITPANVGMGFPIDSMVNPYLGTISYRVIFERRNDDFRVKKTSFITTDEEIYFYEGTQWNLPSSVSLGNSNVQTRFGVTPRGWKITNSSYVSYLGNNAIRFETRYIYNNLGDVESCRFMAILEDSPIEYLLSQWDFLILNGNIIKVDHYHDDDLLLQIVNGFQIDPYDPELTQIYFDYDDKINPLSGHYLEFALHPFRYAYFNKNNLVNQTLISQGDTLGDSMSFTWKYDSSNRPIEVDHDEGTTFFYYPN